MAIVGIDEVGRGAWAGPLLVIASRQKSKLPSGIADSKLVPKNKRMQMLSALKKAFDFGEGWVWPKEIDKHGLAEAMRIGVDRALSMLGAEYDDQIIMDGKVNYCPVGFKNVRCVVKADKSHKVVGAASIYAKVLRDNYMVIVAKVYSSYLFERHVGYGTAAHLESLEKYGPCIIHRLSYKPLLKYLP